MNLGGSAHDFTVHAGAGYLLNTRTDSVTAYDLTDPRKPRPVGAVGIPGTPFEMVAGDSVGFVAFSDISGGDGVAILTLTDPLHPVLRDTIHLAETGISSVALAGPSHLAVLSFSGALYIVDISNPGSPAKVSSIQVPHSQRHVKTIGSYASTGGTLVSTRNLLQPQVVDIFAPPASNISEDLVFRDSLIYALYGESGLYILRLDTLSTAVVDNEKGRSPSTVSLVQNFPNPFNPRTAISFQLSGASFVTLRVYDLLGREVASLVNEKRPPGMYTVEFDGSDLASGLYFCRLTAGEFVQSRKMLLLK